MPRPSSTIVVVAGPDAVAILPGLDALANVRAASLTGSATELVAQSPSGRWWPDPTDDWLRDLPHAVPDRVGLL